MICTGGAQDDDLAEDEIENSLKSEIPLPLAEAEEETVETEPHQDEEVADVQIDAAVTSETEAPASFDTASIDASVDENEPAELVEMPSAEVPETPAPAEVEVTEDSVDGEVLETALGDERGEDAKFVHQEPVVEEAIEDADSEDEEPLNDFLADDAATLDEEALREMVSDLVRQELQGILGERITRNVRRLVRREIKRALAMRDLE